MNETYNNSISEDSEVRHIIASGVDHKAKIKIVGVGGAGGNAVNRMINMNIKDVEFIAINTDALALDNNLADAKIAIGQQTTKALGAGAKPEVGRQALMEDKDTVEKKLEGADMVFISAGMGGGTGTGAAPVVAEIAHKLGILTVAVVTMPFQWEGPVRRRNAEKGLAALRKSVDSIIVINNQRIMEVIEKNTPMKDAFLKVDEVLGNAVRSICDIMFIHGTINVDFNDARTIMSNGGSALMGTGTASGEDRALKAAQEAITCPLLDNIKVSGAAGALINVAHGENFSMSEYNDALEYLYQQIGEDNEPNIVAGDVTIPSLGDKVSITVIATGFDKRNAEETIDTASVATKTPIQRQAPHVEAATARPTIDFVALAGTQSMPQASLQTVAQPTMQTAQPQYSETATMHVIQAVPTVAPVAAPAAAPVETVRSTSPMFTSFLNQDFNAREPAVREEEVAAETPTMVMPQTVVKQELTRSNFVPEEAPALSSEESCYGIPSFLKNSRISEQDF